MFNQKYFSSPLIMVLAIILLYILPTHAVGQGNTIVKDFNNDKSFDFLVKGMEWQVIENWDYVLTDGKTGKRWGYASTIGYFGAASFISIGMTRNELSQDWDPIISAIEDTLIQSRTEPDPSLEWVLNAESLYQSGSESIFGRVVKFEKKWYPGEPVIAQNYTYTLNPEDLDQMIMIEADSQDISDTGDTNDTYYWYYRSHNHKDERRTPDPFDVNGQKYFKTKHALIEFHEGRYSWIFMSGVSQTGGPSKLRWPSIKKVMKQDGLLFLQQSVVVGEYSFWIGDLNMDNGEGNPVWAKIRNNRMDGWEDFRIEGGKLILSDRDGETTEIPIDDIRSQIENL